MPPSDIIIDDLFPSLARAERTPLSTDDDPEVRLVALDWQVDRRRELHVNVEGLSLQPVLPSSEVGRPGQSRYKKAGDGQ